MQKILIYMVKGYQFLLSPWIGQHCRFYPSCSNYALVALERFGVLRGSLLTIKRIIRCHPLCTGGIDHVPEKFGKS